MERKKNKKDNNAILEDKKIQKARKHGAKEFKKEIKEQKKEFDSLMSSQMDALKEFYSTAGKEDRRNIESSMAQNQEMMRDALDSMQEGIDLFGDYMSEVDKKVMETLYTKRVEDLDKLNDSLKDTFKFAQDAVEEMGDNATKSFSDIFESLRGSLNALNINNIAGALGDSIDSMVENRRQMSAVVSKDFDYKKFSKTVANTVKESSYKVGRAEVAEVLSSMVITFGVDDIDSLGDYADSVTAAQTLMGASVSSLENVIWADMKAGGKGKVLKSTLGALAKLNKEGLNLNYDDLLEALNGFTETAYGLAEGDADKQTELMRAYGAVVAASEDSTYTQVTDMLNEMFQFSGPNEFLQSDTASKLLGMGMREDMTDFYNKVTSGSAEDLLSAAQTMDQTIVSYIKTLENEGFYDRAGLGWSKPEMQSYLKAFENDTGFSQSLESAMEKTAGMSDEELSKYLEKANEEKEVGRVQEIKNASSANPVVSFLGDLFGKWNIDKQNIANAVVIAMGAKDAIKGTKDFVSGARGAKDAIKGTKDFVSGARGGGLRGLAKKGASKVGSAVTKFTPYAAPVAQIAGGAAIAGIGAYEGYKDIKKMSDNSSTDSEKAGRGLSLAGNAVGVAGGATAMGVGIATLAGAATIPVVGWVAAAVGLVGIASSALVKKINEQAGAVKEVNAEFANAKKALKDDSNAEWDKVKELKKSVKKSNSVDEMRRLVVESGALSEQEASDMTTSQLKNFTKALAESTKETIKNSGNAFDEMSKAQKEMAEKIAVEKNLPLMAEAIANEKDEPKQIEMLKALGYSDREAEKMAAMNNTELEDKLSSSKFGSRSKIYKASNSDLMTIVKKYGIEGYKDISKEVNSDLVSEASNAIGTLKTYYDEAITGVGLKNGQIEDYRNALSVLKKAVAENISVKEYVDSSIKGGLEAYAEPYVNFYQKEYGEYKKGLSEVPFDGFPAVLHEGEAVLTKAQGNILRNTTPDGGIPLKTGVSDALGGMEETYTNSNVFIKKDEDKYKLMDRMADDVELVRVGMGMKKGAKTSKGSWWQKIFGIGNIGSHAEGAYVKEPELAIIAEKGPEVVLNQEQIDNVNDAIDGSRSNMQNIWNYLVSRGLSKIMTAGIMGNLQAESGFNPQNLQNTYEKKFGMSDPVYTEAVDNGTYGNFVNDNAGYGIAQWTYYSRKQNLIEKAKKYGKSIGDLGVQLEYLYDEAVGYGYTNKNFGSIKEASDWWLHYFESPYDQSASVENYRASLAQSVYDSLASYDVGTAWVPNDQVALIHRGEMIVPEEMNPLRNFVGSGSNVRTAESLNSIVYGGSKEDNNDVVEAIIYAADKLSKKLDEVKKSGETSTNMASSMNADNSDVFAFVPSER